MDDGVRLLTEARLGQVPAAAMTHREGETAEHLELVVDGLVRALVTAPGRSHDAPTGLPVRALIRVGSMCASSACQSASR